VATCDWPYYSVIAEFVQLLVFAIFYKAQNPAYALKTPSQSIAGMVLYTA
jgi:hypothetical protein